MMKQISNRKLRRQKRNRFFGALYASIIYALFYIPVLVMIQFSFNDAKRNYSWEGFTTMWYGKLFSFRNHDLWEALAYSLIIAVIATIISVAIGVLGGVGLKKFEFRGKRFINLMLYVPIVVPEIVLAVSMLIIFMTIGIKLGMGTIVIGHCTFCIPYAVVTIKGRISGDNETLQEASMLLPLMVSVGSYLWEKNSLRTTWYPSKENPASAAIRAASSRSSRDRGLNPFWVSIWVSFIRSA